MRHFRAGKMGTHGSSSLRRAQILWWFCLAGAVPALALDTASGNDEIPPLRPPRAELPPGFWEQHAVLIGVTTALVILAVAAVVWLVLRPKARPAPAPEQVARRQLQMLKNRPADPQLLTRVSHVVRRYLAGAFGLPREELTTAEFCRALEAQTRMGSPLANRAAVLLRSWDEQKFSPTPPPAAGDPVSEAAAVVDQGEARLARLRAEEMARAEAERQAATKPK